MTLMPDIAQVSFPVPLDAYIEICSLTGSVKYEKDKSLGRLRVDRIMSSSMIYPCNYGFIEGTLSGDGDPLDVLVHTSHTLLPGSVVAIRPIGALLTEDEAGEDAKILALPLEKIDPFVSYIQELSDLPQIFLDRIVHFFANYKALEPNKSVNVKGWEDRMFATALIKKALYDFTTNSEIKV